MSLDRRITALIPTFNNEKIIHRCLESVKWADEILVVDSFSTDKTLEIARAYAARIIQHEYRNSATQKNWAIPQCKYEWILQMDTDEDLEEGAVAEIRDAVDRAHVDFDAFRLPRKNYIFRKPLEVSNLYPDYQLRLFRREVARFEHKEVHAHLRVPGKVGTLHHHIKHFSMPTITKQLSHLDRYSRYQAKELSKRGRRFRWHHLVVRPLFVFAYFFLWKRGFLAGSRGVMVSAIATAMDFWSYAKLWEIQAMAISKART